jgi:hypothetical protein
VYLSQVKGYQLDFDDWHAHVHGTLDYGRLLHPQPATRQVLADITLRKHLFTNADAQHAATCLSLMGLSDCFEVRCALMVRRQPVMRQWLHRLRLAQYLVQLVPINVCMVLGMIDFLQH